MHINSPGFLFVPPKHIISFQKLIVKQSLDFKPTNGNSNVQVSVWLPTLQAISEKDSIVSQKYLDDVFTTVHTHVLQFLFKCKKSYKEVV